MWFPEWGGIFLHTVGNVLHSSGLDVLLFSDVFMEKHWKSVIHRSICDYFFEAQSKVRS